MAKTQTITFKKAGTSWANDDEARAAMITAIDATSFSTDDLVTLAQSTNSGTPSASSLDGQTYTEVRTFTDDEYTAYKNDISSLETDVQAALEAAGWEITDTVE
jgi:hypothetical protein|tara:strand:- start:149 stop:460 length:312 start_codon:yes stop_codon:yes gene_type:complete